MTKEMRAGLIIAVAICALMLTESFAQVCSNSSVGLPPLNDLGTGFYRGLQGGLYPGGENVRPQAHNAAGLAIAQQIRPLDVDGNPDDVQGKIVLLSIGMSNTMQEFQYLQTFVDSIENKNPHLVLINGAQGGQDIDQIIDSTDSFWQRILDTLTTHGLTVRQVQVIWFKEAEAYPLVGNDTAFVPYLESLTMRFKIAMNIIKAKYENAQLCYVASRIYGGYSTYDLNPEPFAWYTGWTVKQMIEEQINGNSDLVYSGPNARSPWLAWGSYLWADGTSPRSDGLTWICPGDYLPDGIHPSDVGRAKAANILLDFFMNDETTVPWFLDSTQTGVGTSQGSLPIAYDVSNYPNPFNPSTTIRFELPVARHATLIVYDLLGREVERLIDGEMAPGVHEVRFIPPAKASGVYIYRLTAGLNTASGTMVFVK